jgi:hypothetical protein
MTKYAMFSWALTLRVVIFFPGGWHQVTCTIINDEEVGSTGSFAEVTSVKVLHTDCFGNGANQRCLYSLGVCYITAEKLTG